MRDEVVKYQASLSLSLSLSACTFYYSYNYGCLHQGHALASALSLRALGSKPTNLDKYQGGYTSIKGYGVAFLDLG